MKMIYKTQTKGTYAPPIAEILDLCPEQALLNGSLEALTVDDEGVDEYWD